MPSYRNPPPTDYMQYTNSQSYPGGIPTGPQEPTYDIRESRKHAASRPAAQPVVVKFPQASPCPCPPAMTCNTNAESSMHRGSASQASDSTIGSDPRGENYSYFHPTESAYDPPQATSRAHRPQQESKDLLAVPSWGYTGRREPSASVPHNNSAIELESIHSRDSESDIEHAPRFESSANLLQSATGYEVRTRGPGNTASIRRPPSRDRHKAPKPTKPGKGKSSANTSGRTSGRPGPTANSHAHPQAGRTSQFAPGESGGGGPPEVEDYNTGKGGCCIIC